MTSDRISLGIHFSSPPVAARFFSINNSASERDSLGRVKKVEKRHFSGGGQKRMEMLSPRMKTKSQRETKTWQLYNQLSKRFLNLLSPRSWNTRALCVYSTSSLNDLGNGMGETNKIDWAAGSARSFFPPSRQGILTEKVSSRHSLGTQDGSRDKLLEPSKRKLFFLLSSEPNMNMSCTFRSPFCLLARHIWEGQVGSRK